VSQEEFLNALGPLVGGSVAWVAWGDREYRESLLVLVRDTEDVLARSMDGATPRDEA
jgi:hypothetical protein